MEFLPAQCRNPQCGHIFSSPIPVMAGGFLGNMTNCELCGATADIVNAFGEGKGKRVSIYPSDRRSADIIAKYKALISVARDAAEKSDDISIDEILAMVAGIDQEWAERLSSDKNRGKRYLIFALFILARLLIVGAPTGVAIDYFLGDEAEKYVDSQPTDGFDPEVEAEPFVEKRLPEGHAIANPQLVRNDSVMRETTRSKKLARARQQRAEAKEFARLRRENRKATDASRQG